MNQLINDHLHKSQSDHESFQDNRLDCCPLEAEEAMREFRDAKNNVENENVDITEMITALNSDQKRIFEKISNTIASTNSNTVLRLYVSGEGGTGKSFLIKVIRCWIKQTLNKDTAVTAPTGIAAFNIDGMTIHRLFQLPVEHGHTPKYRSP
ncbi:uncharacterized protein LOC144478182 [Augochlora pura]